MGYLRQVDFKDLEESRQKEFAEEVKRIFKRNNLDAGDFVIDYVSLGNASEPYNVIHLKGGLELYDETNSPSWSAVVNTAAIPRNL